MTWFDRSARGGAIASRVDHQDAVAVLIALRILAGEEIFGLGPTEPYGVVLHCEGRDDLEIVTPDTHCVASVKAQSSSLALVSQEYSRISTSRSPDHSRQSSFALILVGPQPTDVTSLADYLEEARSLLANRHGQEAEGIRADFHKRWPQLEGTSPDEFYLEVGLPRLYSLNYTAIAVQMLRRIASLTDYTDDRAMLLLSDLTTRMAKARSARGSVTLSQIRDSIFDFALPLSLVTLPHAYVRTKYGYMQHPGISQLLEQESRDVLDAVRVAMRRYRRATRKHRIAALLAGPVRCISCDGPFMANMYGWTRRGIACSRCGFSPYISLFYACTCRHPLLLLAQPPLELVDVAVSIRRAIEALRCEHCGEKPRPERLQTRIFQLNVPWPPEDYSDKDLIEAREDFGWSKMPFRDGKENPREILLQEALQDRIDSRFIRPRRTGERAPVPGQQRWG